jgi:group I intron endonuclease
MSTTTAVYTITHKSTGRRYVGITQRPAVRFKEHLAAAKRGSNTRFARTLRKYGYDLFVFEILGWCENVSVARLVEIALIKHLAAAFNETRGGEGTIGRKNSPEHRQAIRESKLGRTRDADTVAKVGASLRGRALTAAHKENIRKARLGVKFTPEHRENMRRARLGVSGKSPTEEVRQKLSAALKGRVRSAEHCEAIRQAALKRWATKREAA